MARSFQEAAMPWLYIALGALFILINDSLWTVIVGIGAVVFGVGTLGYRYKEFEDKSSS